MTLVPLPATLLSVRQIERVDVQFAAALGLDVDRQVSVGLVTCDSDDALYVAMDEATKFANVDVVFGRSFYGGAAIASGPLSGEAMGVVAGDNPDDVSEALWSIRESLQNGVRFHRFDRENSPAFFARVIGETGRYLAPQAGIEPGEPMAYLVAPPMEAVVGIDAALKNATVTLAQWMPPPTETNFAAAYLVGELAQLNEAAAAFVEAIGELVAHPMAGMRRPARLRR